MNCTELVLNKERDDIRNCKHAVSFIVLLHDVVVERLCVTHFLKYRNEFVTQGYEVKTPEEYERSK